MTATVLVDAEGAVKAWLDGLSIRSALIPQRSGPAYLLLSRIGGVPDSTAGLDHARISAIAHGPTKQQALNLAVQYANAVWNLNAGTVLTLGVVTQGADVDSGPSELSDSSGVSRYGVEATFHVGAV